MTSLVFVGNASEGVVAALNSLKCMMGKRECGDGGGEFLVCFFLCVIMFVFLFFLFLFEHVFFYI